MASSEGANIVPAAAGDGLTITGLSFVNAAAAHCGLHISLLSVSHLTSIDVRFNIKIDDEQPLPKPPEGTPNDILEALTMDGNKPNAGDYNCIKDMYNTSKFKASKALSSAHEMYGDGKMDHHLFTDIATMDKPCEPCLQAIIGGAIKTFVDAKDMDTYTCREHLGVTAAITHFNFPAMIPLWSIPMPNVTGNTLILKPSKRVPSASMIIAERCKCAGTPKGVSNLVNGTIDVINNICNDPCNKDASSATLLNTCTNYCFYVSPDHIAGALDRFTQSFLESLFDSSCSERETKTTNSKHKKSPQSDMWCSFQLGKITISTLKDYMDTQDKLASGWIAHKSILFDLVSKRITAEVKKDGKLLVLMTADPVLWVVSSDFSHSHSESENHASEVYQDAPTVDDPFRSMNGVSTSAETSANKGGIGGSGVRAVQWCGDNTIAQVTANTNTGPTSATLSSATRRPGSNDMMEHSNIPFPITLIEKLIKWQSIHDNNLPISTNYNEVARLSELMFCFKEKSELANKAEGFVKHAECLKLIHGQHLILIAVGQVSYLTMKLFVKLR